MVESRARLGVVPGQRQSLSPRPDHSSLPIDGVCQCWKRIIWGSRLMVFRFVAGLCSVIAVVACPGCGSPPSEDQVLVERDSLKVVAAKAFPKDLACQIFVGAAKKPSFRTTGADWAG
jgi:hypothetical protein